MFDNFDTIIAPATVVGTGAISLLRISGSRALEVTDAIVRFKSGTASQAAPNTVKYGIVPKGDGVLDEVLCCIYRSPRSYTGEDSVEIMCHASSYIASELLAKALDAGCRMARPGEFTQRAFLSGKMDLTQAEAVADVISSSAEASHRVAMNQLRGGFSKKLSSLRSKLLTMTSLLELELDFSEEDVEFADRAKLNALVDEVISSVSSLASSFKLGNAVKNGIPVAIVGPANAGKSTLLNAILGEQRAIVSDIAGTTRDTIEECFNLDGVLFRFVDTAGIRSGNIGEIERIGIGRSYDSIIKADVVILVLDASVSGNASSGYVGSSPTACSSGSSIARDILSRIDFDRQSVIVALNKCDLVAGKGDNKNVSISNNFVSSTETELYNEFGEKISSDKIQLIKISAKNGIGLKNLLSSISESQKKRLSNTSSDTVLVTNIRHYEALLTARKNLLSVRSGLNGNSPIDLIAEDLRAALSTLGSITGEITTDDVLGEIFGRFCVGK